MPRPLDPHRDHTRGTFEDWFFVRLVVEMFGDFGVELLGLGLRVLGWLFWQTVRLLCAVIAEGLSAWPL